MSKILFAQHQRKHILKFVGDIRVNVAPTITAYLERVGSQDETDIVLDLKSTTCMDSTCLGLLAKIAIASKQHLGSIPTLVTTNPDVTRVIDSMGFEQLFCLVREDAHTCDEAHELPTRVMNEDQLTEQVVEAHKTLMSLSKHNEDCFRDLVLALEAEQAEGELDQQKVS